MSTMVPSKMNLSSLAAASKHVLYTLWLLMADDFAFYLVPEIVQGILGALSGPLLFANGYPDVFLVLSRVPHIIVWVTLHTLIFDLSNQRLPGSIIEDKVNKPRRPIASGRISPQQADQLLIVLIAIQFILSKLYLGGTEETFILYSMDWMYNDIGSADDNFVIRNLILGLGLPIVGKGATSVVLKDSSYTFNQDAWLWYMLVGTVIFSTIHTQDLKDIAGDLARNRKTTAIVLGDANTRLGLFGAIIVWSVICPMYWDTQRLVTVATLSLGTLVASRLMLFRNREADRKTYKIYACWLLLIKSLPWVTWVIDQSGYYHIATAESIKP